jgi:hypothetical protein
MRCIKWRFIVEFSARQFNAISKIRALVAVTFVLLILTVTVHAFVGDPENNSGSNTAANSVTEPSVVYPKPLAIDSISEGHVCGKTAEGSRVCIGNVPQTLNAADSVSKLQSFIAGGGHFCGRDERGIRCWQTEGRFEKPVREILSEGLAEMARFGHERICVPQKDRTIRCYQPEVGRWIQNRAGESRYALVRPPMETYGPFADMRDFRILDKDICLIDGENLLCIPFVNKQDADPAPRDVLPVGPFKGARSLVGSWGSFCVLSDAGLSCAFGREASERKQYNVAGDWTTATDLQIFGYDGFCARAKSGTPLCVRIDSNSQQISDAVPAEYKQPGVEVLKFDINGDRLCALTRDVNSQKTSFSCLIYSTVTDFPQMNHLVDFRVGSDSTCGIDKRGWVSCFSGNYHRPSPLPEDGSEIQVAGQCRWNSTRFHCSNTDIAEDFSTIRKVIAVSPAASNDHPCIIFENHQDIRQVRCFGSNQTLSSNAPLVDGDMTKITSKYQTACLYGGSTVNCWGAEIGGSMPNLNSVKKLLFADDFACATDYFGFLCWGNEIESRGLTPPANYSDIDFVQDFAVGDEHICAITRENRLECWGKNSSGQLDAPMVSNPTSIAISGKTSCVSSDQGVTCWGHRLDSL